MTRFVPTLAPWTGDVPVGTALDTDKTIPTLFTPTRIRGLEIQNRFVVSPMGTWSAVNGHLTEFHVVHYGAFALRGAALAVVEATSVTFNGRTSPQDSGLWQDSQIQPLKRVFDFIHAQGQKAGIQLNHAGRKSGMLAPRLSPGGVLTIASEGNGGWPDDVWAPSAISHSEPFVTPKALTVELIESLIQSFGSAARRAVQAGADFIEIHGAHGYLIHQFLSPLTNHRTDEYGGSFENRVRFLLRVIHAVRSEMPDSMPLSLRISAVEWMEWSGKPSWDFEQTLKLIPLLPGVGVDVLDVSSGGNLKEQNIQVHPRYQIDLAGAVRRFLQKNALPLVIGSVGFINSPEIAMHLVQEKETAGKGSDSVQGHEADLAFIGRQFLREPEFVLNSAHKLNVEVKWPFQYEKARHARTSKLP